MISAHTWFHASSSWAVLLLPQVVLSLGLLSREAFSLGLRLILLLFLAREPCRAFKSANCVG